MGNQSVVRRPGCSEGIGDTAQQDALVNLVVQRLALAQDVAAAKYRSGAPIDDPVREGQILQSAARALNVASPDHRAEMQFLRDQIESSKVIQRGLHHRWRLHPEEIPATNPDLAAEVRPRLDCITKQMIQQLKCGIPRFEPEGITSVLDMAFSKIAPELQLPELRRHAAVFAMRSLRVGLASN